MTRQAYGLGVLFLLLLSPGQAPADAADGEWKYQCPPAGAPFEHPPLRAISLVAEKPGYLTETATYRGARRRYGRFIYGSAGSSPVSVVLDELPDGGTDLYVDGNRDRAIETFDRAEGREREWRASLDAAVLEGGGIRYVPRKVLFRLGATGTVFSYAPLGFLEGEVTLKGKKVAARRVDGDGNGAFTDAQDRLWLDLDGNGQWDPLAEQLPYTPALELAGERYVARSEQFGEWLALDRLEGTGTFRLAAKPNVAFKALAATIYGEDGSAVGLQGPGATAAVPPGQYRLVAVTAVVDDPKWGEPWTFVFSEEGSSRPRKSYTVVKGETVEIEPFASLSCVPVLQDARKTYQAGQDLRVDAHLYTGDGLKATSCYVGSGDRQAGSANTRLAHITLATAAGQTLADAWAEFG